MQYWSEGIEVIERGRLAGLQLEKLKKVIDRASRSPFYAQHFSRAGINPQQIDSLEIADRLPFTDKDHLRDAYPYGLLTLDKREVVRMHASSGTTGRPTVVFHNIKDIENWADLMARSLYAAGARSEDVFQNMTTYGLFTGGLGLHYGAEKLGMLIIPASAGNTERQLKLMQDFSTTVIHATPSYALHLIDKMAETGDPKRFGIKLAVLGAEPYSEATRRKIEKALGCSAVNSYGLSEMNGPGVAFECEHRAGMHIWEDAYLVEIIDPETGEPKEAGEVGELVLTSLDRIAMPIIRYRTRDLTSIIPEPCACGRTHVRLERFKGRSDDMLIVSGVNIFPSQIENILMETEAVGSNYQIVLDREKSLDRMKILVETISSGIKGNASGVELSKKLSASLRSGLLVKTEIELLDPGELPPSTGKAVRVIDNRDL